MKAKTTKKTSAKAAPAKAAKKAKAPVKAAAKTAKKACKCKEEKGKCKCAKGNAKNECECGCEKSQRSCFESLIDEIFSDLNDAKNVENLFKDYFYTRLLAKGLDETAANALANRLEITVGALDVNVAIEG